MKSSSVKIKGVRDILLISIENGDWVDINIDGAYFGKRKILQWSKSWN